MNTRTAVHIIATVAAAIAGGTYVFQGLSVTANHDLGVIAAIIGLVATTYLTSTSTGLSSVELTLKSFPNSNFDPPAADAEAHPAPPPPARPMPDAQPGAS